MHYPLSPLLGLVLSTRSRYHLTLIYLEVGQWWSHHQDLNLLYLVKYQYIKYSQISESHVVDMVASRHALQLTHCRMSTSLFSQPYCAQWRGESARGLANHVNGCT